MADQTTAFVPTLPQVLHKREDKTAAARAKAYRQRKRQRAEVATAARAEAHSSEILIPPEFLSVDGAIAEPPGVSPAVTPPAATADRDEAVIQPAVTPRHDEPVTTHEQSERDFTWNIGLKRANLLTIAPSRHYFAQVLLMTAALILGAAGVAINGWFARSLGSSDAAGWLFLAVGVSADLVALVLPSTAAGLWQSRKRLTALVGWAAWLLTFVFAVTASIGFASTNIIDVTLMRESRVTPTMISAQAALTDAVAARDRECKGGVGKFCRERETAVVERRQVLDSAMKSVEQAADPQTIAAIRLVAWGSAGSLRPAPEDFAMLRLILMALLPQIGGLLLLVGRHSEASKHSVVLPASHGNIPNLR